MNRQQLEQALQNDNVRKFLTFLSMSEGTAPFKDPYLARGGTRGELLSTGYTNHPALLGTEGNWKFKNNDGVVLNSTANGRYAITKPTWQMVNKALGGNLTFSPQDQDLAAVYLMANRGALTDVMSGNVNTAIHKLGKEWASLPTAPDSYKQYKNQWDKVYGMLATAGFDPKAIGAKGNYVPYEVKGYGDVQTPQQIAKKVGDVNSSAVDALTGQGGQELASNDIGLGRRSPTNVNFGVFRPTSVDTWRKRSTLDALGGF